MGELREFLATPLVWAGDVATLLWSLFVGLLIFAALSLLRWLLRRRLRSPNGPVDALLLDGVTRIHRPVILSMAATVGLRLLPLPEPFPSLLHQAQWLILAAQFAVWADLLASFGALAISRTLSEGKYHIPGLQLGIKLILWVLVGITTLDNLGVDLSSLLTGLGIGGIAVALAAQRVIGDLISTVTIAMDRPFVEGDFIHVGDVSGKVLRIGLKTTRLRTVTGEELIVPNADLVNLRVRNFSRMEERKVTLPLLLSWGTPSQKMEALPAQIEALFGDLQELRFGGALLTGTQEWGFQLEISYAVSRPEFSLHQKQLQEVLLRVTALLEREGISLGHPLEGRIPSPDR